MSDVEIRENGTRPFDGLRCGPLDGVPEDPATGSANCALAALLTHCNTAPGGSFHWRIAQGVEMGRPSILEARTETREGAVVDAWIGGASVMVSDGYIGVGERRSRQR